jgi:hypothetical protein
MSTISSSLCWVQSSCEIPTGDKDSDNMLTGLDLRYDDAVLILQKQSADTNRGQ